MKLWSVVFLVALVACQKKGTKAAHTRPQTFEELFGASKAPALVGPLTPYHWGMPLADAVARGSEAEVLNFGQLRYSLIGGAGQPALLEQVSIDAPGSPDPRPVLEKAWGKPFVVYRDRPIWVGSDTRAELASGNRVELVAMKPLATWLGTGDRLGFETERMLTDITADEVKSKYGSFKQSDRETLQLGHDEIYALNVNYTLGADGRVSGFTFYVVVPPDLASTRGQLVMKRFGVTSVAPGTPPVAFGPREVAIGGRGEMWTITVRRKE